MEYNSKDLARYLVAYANDYEPRVSMSPVKLQKLLYICYGVSLALNFGRLTEEHPQAWPYGPVFASTHKPMSRLFDSRFNDMLHRSDAEFNTFEGDTNLQYILRNVFSAFGQWAPMSLVNWSHRKGGAWKETMDISNKYGTVISDELIKEVFLDSVVRK